MNFFLKKKFDSTKCKTLLQLTIQRIKILRNKDAISISKLRGEIAKLLHNGQDSNPAVENLLRQTNIVAAYDMIEQFCEVIINRLAVIKSQKDCPAHSKEAIASLIYAADCCAELLELQKLKKIFVSKYGSEFYMAVKDQQPGCGVNMQIVANLTPQLPNHVTKTKLMKEIADEHNIKWNQEYTALNIPIHEVDSNNASSHHLAGETQISEADQTDGKKPVSIAYSKVNIATLGDEAKDNFEQGKPVGRKVTSYTVQGRRISEYKFRNVEDAAEFTFLCASEAAEAAKVTLNMIKMNARKKKTNACNPNEGVQQPNAMKETIKDSEPELAYSVHSQVATCSMGEVAVEGFETTRSRIREINSQQDLKNDIAEFSDSDAHENVREMPYFDNHDVVTDLPDFDEYEDVFEKPLFDEHAGVSDMFYFCKHEDVSELQHFDKDEDVSKISQFENHDAISEKPFFGNDNHASVMQRFDLRASDDIGTDAYFATTTKTGECTKSFKELEDRWMHENCSNLHNEELCNASDYHHELNVDEEKYSGQFDNSPERVVFLSQRSPLSDVKTSFKMGGTRYRKPVTYKKLEWHSKRNSQTFDSPGTDGSVFEPSDFDSGNIAAVSDEVSSDLSNGTRKPNLQITSDDSGSTSPSYQEQMFTGRALDARTLVIEPSKTFNRKSVRSTKSRLHQDITSPIAMNFNPLVGR